MMAEKQGFEPWHTVTCLRAFQARPFSLLGISPCWASTQLLLRAIDIILKSTLY